MFIKCETFVIETKFEIEMKCSFLKVTITIVINEQLNEFIIIKVAKIKTII